MLYNEINYTSDISYLNNFFEDANKAWWGKECRLLGNRIECGTNAKDIKNNALFSIVSILIDYFYIF